MNTFGVFVFGAVVCSAAFAGEPSPAPPTWARDVAPILYGNCIDCHRPSQVAPFSLLTYEDAAKRAKFIARTVRTHVMPPWLPDGPVGAFLDERRLSVSEISTLERWAAAGAPKGDGSMVPPVPSMPQDGWRLGPPDLIVRMPKPFQIPAGPDDSYRVFPASYSVDTVPPSVLASARISGSDLLGVAAIEIRPGNNRSFHHGDIWLDPAGEARRRETAEGGIGYASFGTPGFNPEGWLGGRVPGMTARFLPPGIAASVMPPKGDVAFQVHYRATGKPETDQSEVGIYFMREPSKRLVDALLLRCFKLDIPAGERKYAVEDSLEVPADCILLSVFPHMHFIGREVHASVVNPDGSSRPLLDINRWNFQWQDRYVYHEPFMLPKGAVIHCRWVYDNSESNPSNPFSPPRPIQYGPNATDEMCALRLEIVPINLDDAPLFHAAQQKKMKEKIEELSPEQRARFHWEEGLD